MASSPNAPISINQAERRLLAGYGGASGGLVPTGLTPMYRAAGGPIHAVAFPGSPRGTDTVPLWGTPGEYMMQPSAVDRYGVAFMDALNAGTISPAMMGGYGSSTDNSRHVTMPIEVRVIGDASPRQATDVVYELEVLRMQAGAP